VTWKIAGGMLIAVVIAACAAPADNPPPTALPSAALTHDMPPDIADMVLPATGADTRWTQGLDAFTRAVSYLSARACTQAAGVPMPDVPPPLFVRFSEMPDLRSIRAYGFTGGAGPLPDAQRAPAVEQAAKPEVAAVQQRCLADGTQAARPLRELFLPLQAEWLHNVTNLKDDPRIVAAGRGLANCLHENGVKADDEPGFFRLLESRLHDPGNQREAAATELEFARAYATCMEPVERVRDPILQQLRQQFVEQHAAAVEALRAALMPRITELEQRFDLRIAFPTVR
jgi:hypothetical protein